MLLIYLVAALMLGAQVVENASISREDRNMLEEIQEAMESKCLKYAGANAFPELLDAGKDAISYLLSTFPTSVGKDLNTYVQKMCMQLFQDFYVTYANFISKLKVCLNPEEKYLANFVLTAYNVSYEQDCKNDGQALRDAATMAQSESCNITMQYLTNVLMPHCTADLRRELSPIQPGYVLTMAQFCKNIKIVNECYVTGIRDYCKKPTIFDKRFSDAMNVYLALCANETIAKRN